jgi:hypothetical protein
MRKGHARSAEKVSGARFFSRRAGTTQALCLSKEADRGVHPRRYETKKGNGMNLKRIPIAALAALGMTFAAASTTSVPAQAQAQPAQQAPAATAETFSEDKLRSFAVATLQIQDVGQVYQPRIEAAESAEERQELAQEANTQMVQIVAQVDGITVPEYNEIAQAARANPDMMAQINTLIGEELQ